MAKLEKNKLYHYTIIALQCCNNGCDKMSTIFISFYIPIYLTHKYDHGIYRVCVYESSKTCIEQGIITLSFNLLHIVYWLCDHSYYACIILVHLVIVLYNGVHAVYSSIC